MKKRCLWALLMIPILFSSCEKDEEGFTQIKGIESLIYQVIKAHREDNGLTGPFVHQFVMVKEAQIYSYKMANDAEAVGTQGLAEHWNTIHEKIGGTNDQALVLRTTSNNEDLILSELMQLSGGEDILLSDVTQCGIGVEDDATGNHYITVLLMKVDS